MQNLRLNGVLLVVILFLTGCQTPGGFKMTDFEKEELHIVEVDRNRVTQKCYFLNAEKENNWRHLYALHMLNDRKEVISVYYPITQGKHECREHLKKVEKVLKNQSSVKLCVRDRLERVTKPLPKPEFYDFEALGKHESPYAGLTFDTICNTKECVSISDTGTTTCPDFIKPDIKGSFQVTDSPSSTFRQPR